MELKFIHLLCALVLFGASEVQSKKVVVCYQGTWATYRWGNGKFEASNIDPNLCTHLMYAFFGVNTDGSIALLDSYLDLEDNYGLGNIKKFIQLRNINPDLKVLAAVGGWNQGSEKYSAIANDPVKRNRFITTSISFLKQHGFNGLDLDWEYPNQRHSLANDDKTNFVTLLQELKAELNKDNLLLTIAVAATESSASLSYNIPEVSKTVDLINVMTYDLHGSWESVTGINAPLYAGPSDVTAQAKQLNVHASISYWISKGVQKEKLVLGVPFYGRTFTLSDSSKNTIGSPISNAGNAGKYSQEAGFIGYAELCELRLTQDWTYVWEGTQKVPYVYRGNQWVGFDDEASIKLKAQYALDNGLAGIMVWSLESDDFNGVCGKKYILLNAINSIFSGSTGVVTDPPTAATNPPTVATDPPTVATDPPTSATNPPTSATNPPTSATNPPSGSVFVCPAKDGNYRDPNDCSKFFQCSNGIKYSTQCPSNLMYDAAANACNYASLVNCSA